MRKIEIIIKRTKTGHAVYATKYPVATTGKSLPEIKQQIVGALNLYFAHNGIKMITEDDLRPVLDLPQFFKFYKVINAKALSERIGMNQSLLAQYIKGNKKPSAAQTQRILEGVHQIGKELAVIKFL